MPLPPDMICAMPRRAKKRSPIRWENCRISQYLRVNAPERRQSAFGSRVDRHQLRGEGAISATMRFVGLCRMRVLTVFRWILEHFINF